MKPLSWLFVLLVVTGCGAVKESTYRPLDYSGGYREVQLDVDTYKVEFLGNDFTSSVVAGDYALLRSADVCLAAGYPYFSQLSGAQSEHLSGGYGIVAAQGRATYFIKCEKEKTGPSSISAEFTSRSLRQKYKL
jgi:hypothetical protein